MVKATEYDLYRYSGTSYTLTSFLRYFFTHPGFRFVVVLRSCRRFSSFHPLGVLFRLYFKHLQVRFGLQIPHTCNIGKGLFIGHFGNIVVNQRVVLGENCNIAHGVTLGQISDGPKKGSPKIGNRVWIGANAVVVGNITIGNDVMIAPLSFVNFDVPDNGLVMGNPAKVVNFRGSVGYVNNTLPEET